MTLGKLSLVLATALGTISLATPCLADERQNTPHEAMARDILQAVVAMDTSVISNGTPQMAAYLNDLFVAGGFAPDDVTQFKSSPDHTSLIVRYMGADTSRQGIAFIGHLDVVTAYAKDWELNPFELTERGGYFIGRGTADNKAGVVGLTSTFLKLKSEKYVPDRNLFLIFSADEETSVISTQQIVEKVVPSLNIEYVLNSEGGAALLNGDGEAVAHYIQGAEKTYATLELVVRNPGGHSSAPRPDNAIYKLTEALTKVRAHRFPISINEVSAGQLAHTAGSVPEPMASAISALLADTYDKTAEAMVSSNVSLNATIRTTCITTMLNAGHAENALPQSATATINCRITPGTTPDEVFAVLNAVIDDEAVELRPVRILPATEVTPMRDDVMAAVSFALKDRYPGIDIVPAMSAGYTDGMMYRLAGLPTYGLSGLFMVPGEVFAHGLNEKIRVDSFYYSLGFWERLMKRLTGGVSE